MGYRTAVCMYLLYKLTIALGICTDEDEDLCAEVEWSPLLTAAT